jgi:hypothetical protein
MPRSKGMSTWVLTGNLYRHPNDLAEIQFLEWTGAERNFENQKRVGFSAMGWLKSQEPFRGDEGLYPILHLIAYRTDSFSGQTLGVAERPVVPA